MKNINKWDVNRIFKNIIRLPINSSMQDKLFFIKNNYSNIIKELLDIKSFDELKDDQKNEYELLPIVDIRDKEKESEWNITVEFSKFCHGDCDTINSSNKDFYNIHRSVDFLITNQKWEILINNNADVWIHSRHVRAWYDYIETIIELLNITENNMKEFNIQNIIKYLMHNDWENQFTKVVNVKIKNSMNEFGEIKWEFIPMSDIEKMIINWSERGRNNRLNDLLFIKYMDFKSNRLNKWIRNMENIVRKKNDMSVRFIDDKTVF